MHIRPTLRSDAAGIASAAACCDKRIRIRSEGMNYLMTPAALTFPTGPAVGEPFPDFTLPDQTGMPVNFTAARGGRRAMIIIFRSAAW
jgi:hypothetical protein